MGDILLGNARKLHHTRELGGEENEDENIISAPASTTVLPFKGSQQAG